MSVENLPAPKLKKGGVLVRNMFSLISEGGPSAGMDNFHRVMFYGGSKVKKRSYDGSKGHREQVACFVALLQGKVMPELSFESTRKTTLTTFGIRSSLNTGQSIRV